MLAAFIVFLIAMGATALFNYSFPVWIMWMYGVSFAVLSLSAGAFEFICAKKKGKKRSIVNALIAAAGFAACFGVFVYLINNVIFSAGKATLSAHIITVILAVFFTVFLLVCCKLSGKKILPGIVAGILAVTLAGVQLATDLSDMYKLAHAHPVAAPTGLSEFTEKEHKKVEDADFYVSVNGSDENDGSFEKPFATMEKARDAVRTLDKTGKNGITVAVKAGEYRISSLELSKEDSGTKECPVTYCAYGDGEVILNGGVTIKPDNFKKVEDETMLSRLSEEAKDKVICADLKEYGLTADDWGKMYAIGTYNTAKLYDGDWEGEIYCELFVNDERQTVARYPDNDYLLTGEVIDPGDEPDTKVADETPDAVHNAKPPIYGIDGALADRISSWKTLDDVWMFGYWTADWADASTPIGDFDAENRTLALKFANFFVTKTGAPYYFYNVFEELDSPGEWYLDRENGIAYVYPKSDIASCTVDMTITTDCIIKAEETDYLTFDGFTVKGTRGNGIEVTGDNVTVENCLIKNIGGSALLMNGSGNLAYANEITRTGKGGIYISGGERETLKAGNSKADNNLIHDWAEIYQTYQPAVTLDGVGNICSHNEIFNTPHEAITYSGNNHIIEYNNIHDVCLLSDDAGAIYAGRRWDFYGNVIRYNAVYNLGSDGHRPCGIYMDDALSGQTIYGNLLVNVPSIALHLGGGRDLNVYNNIVVNCNDRSIAYDSRARDGVVSGGWFTHSRDKDMEGGMWQLLFESPWQTDTWKKAYPQMQKFSDDFNDTDNPDFVPNPAYSNVNKNIIVNIPGTIGKISDAAKNYSKIDDNYIYRMGKGEKLFNDFANGDYSLKNAPDGFEQIPLDKIGRY